MMAFSGFILAGFVFVHMLGNLQAFLGQEALNAYAYKLQSVPLILWGFRFFLLATTLVHVLTAISIVRENRAARPVSNGEEKYVQATVASRSMGFTGTLLFGFIVFHVLHYTVRITHPEFQDMHYHLESAHKDVHDVYAMIIAGFQVKWVSALYIVCMAFLCLHLSNGVSSLFQSLGLRNEAWRARFDNIATAYGWIVFIGFISVPVAVLTGTLQLPG